MGSALQPLVGECFRLFASPLGRAQSTAQRIAAALGGAKVSLDARLMEIGMGAWDGMTDYEIEMDYPGARAGLGPRDWCFHGPGGERPAGLVARLDAAMAGIAADPAPVRIVVSHAMAGRVIRGRWAGLDWDETLALPAPQNAIFALEPGGTLREIACELPD